MRMLLTVPRLRCARASSLLCQQKCGAVAPIFIALAGSCGHRSPQTCPTLHFGPVQIDEHTTTSKELKKWLLKQT